MGNAIYNLYSGELWRSTRNPVFYSYYHVEFRDGFFMPEHAHNCLEIMCVRKGSCLVYAGGQEYPLEQGEFIFLNGFVPHRLHIEKGTPCRVLCLEFCFEDAGQAGYPFSWLHSAAGELQELLKARENILVLKDTEEAYTHLMEIYRELERAEAPSEALIGAAFSQFLLKLARLFLLRRSMSVSPAAGYVRQAVDFMNEHYHRDIGVEHIARHLNLNISYFHKIFREVTGRTPMDYMNDLRIARARMLLGNTDIPIIDICGFVGFNSRQYFSAAFKKATGKTPREYRQKVQLEKLPRKANASCSGYMG